MDVLCSPKRIIIQYSSSPDVKRTHVVCHVVRETWYTTRGTRHVVSRA